ncbi:MAG: transcriptional regulator NrdR [Firmicutes bacterium]|nr:transcriptional regulator NrdR [Bacillota bacterium]
MRCPFCGYEDSKVLDSRPAEDGNAIRRRRECLECAKRFTTYERIEEIPLMIVKKDGRREVFDRNKLLRGLIKACEKRPTTLAVLEKLVDEVEKELRNTMDQEITSQVVGEMVMEKLRQVDEVAYVRFASVYRQFTDAHKFIQEIEKLIKSNTSQ